MTKDKVDTVLAHAGSHPDENNGAVNPPVYHVSTVVFPSIAEMRKGEACPYDKMRYGRNGTPTHMAFEEAVCALDGGYRSIAVASGQGAIAVTLAALLGAGDHLLIADSVYHPTRRFCLDHLARNGVEVTFYDPLIGAGIEALFKPNTRLVFCESPGSLTFEIQDIPAITEVAHRFGALVAMDNTWATSLHFDALGKGVDINIQAATKFLVGHSDAMLGVLTCKTEAIWRRIRDYLTLCGAVAGCEEVYLGLRGLRTLSVRLKRHEQSGLTIARWLQSRPEVALVIHPALPEDPGHALWKRDFTGACGLFAVEFRPCPQDAVNAFIDELRLFALGYSWGGFESLIIPTSGAIHRTAKPWSAAGPTIRLHIGLEDPEDLMADLAKGMEKLGRAMG